MGGIQMSMIVHLYLFDGDVNNFKKINAEHIFIEFWKTRQVIYFWSVQTNLPIYTHSHTLGQPSIQETSASSISIDPIYLYLEENLQRMVEKRNVGKIGISFCQTY